MKAAVVIVDMLNPYDHPDADKLAANAEAVIEPMQELIRLVGDSDTSLVYVNDNHGDFAASREEIIKAATGGKRPDLVEPIVPPEGTYFLQKVRHSAFYSTALDHFLREEGIETVILAGQATEQCILYSALDAYIRQFDLRVVRDCVAAVDPELGDAALEMMERNMKADLVSAADALAG